MKVWKLTSVLSLAFTLALISGAALAQPKITEGLLTDAGGMTLYVFDNDATVSGKSVCTGACLNVWTPLYAQADATAAGDYAFITRDDGKRQWTYKGKPLYRWFNDEKPGDRDGDGLRQVWHVVKP